jgi:hypothetical protein
MTMAAQKQAQPPKAEDAPPATLRDSNAPAPLQLDLDALAAENAGFQPQGDLPPPPANVLSARDPGTGRYRTVEERDERAPSSRRKSEKPPPARKSERPAPKSERPAARSKGGAAVREERVKRADPRAEPPSEPKQPAASRQSSRPGQPAAVRPAAIFGQARPQQSSIFGEDIISDKSLDEVILSYLAEDLDEGSK